MDFDLHIVDRGSSGLVRGTYLPRYSVWKRVYPMREKPECLDLGDDLAALQATHGPGLPVVDHSPRALRRRR